MMNFSAFGGPFSGIHQFAAKFGHDTQTGAFSSTNGMTQDIHGNRYHTNGNHFPQNTATIGNSAMQYGQNISLPYAQQPTDHNNMFNNDHKNNIIKTKMERDREDVINQQILQNVNQSWQTLANPGNTVDYSSHLLSATLPISIQHFLKYSETIKKESVVGSTVNNSTGTANNLNLTGMDTNIIGGTGINGGISTTSGFNIKTDLLNLKNGVGNNLNLALGNHVGNTMVSGNLTGINNHHTTTSTSTLDTTSTTIVPHVVEATTTTGKKKKKKAPKVIKEKKPRPKPGEIRETKALDGSTLYCCPECQMAYPDKCLIEQHVISHAVERRFVCDICNAALKRKDHLTRHKLSHIPDRPHVCNICLKSFKRKEQLTLHIVIHSGEKKHVCQECGKGFYRKDHLRKHTRSHIARRVKSEVSAQIASNTQTTAVHGS